MITLKDAVPLHLLGPVSAVLLVLLAGCAGVPTEVRYNENTLSYTSLPAGMTSTSARDEAVTARYRVGKNEGATTYMSLPSGVQSRSGRLDGVTSLQEKLVLINLSFWRYPMYCLILINGTSRNLFLAS